MHFAHPTRFGSVSMLQVLLENCVPAEVTKVSWCLPYTICIPYKMDSLNSVGIQESSEDLLMKLGWYCWLMDASFLQTTMCFVVVVYFRFFCSKYIMDFFWNSCLPSKIPSGRWAAMSICLRNKCIIIFAYPSYTRGRKKLIVRNLQWDCVVAKIKIFCLSKLMISIWILFCFSNFN